jgi:dihydrolipoamide dehydrogenase
MTSKKKEFDVAVLGAGPGGYPAAIKAAQSGAKVCLIEAKELGGTCLNRGCIPSKALIANAETYQTVCHADRFGIKVDGVSFDYAFMANRKDEVVKGIRDSLEGLLINNSITILRGHGKYISPREIKVMGDDNVIVHAEKSIIATGSEPRDIPAFPCDHQQILDSTSVLYLMHWVLK